ncbi:MAG: hypothetical protein R3C12_15445 [Planctomycetaceae bacterium]
MPGEICMWISTTPSKISASVSKAIRQVLGDKQGITRYGSMTLPMDETLVTVAVDLGGRYWFGGTLRLPDRKSASSIRS